MELDSHWIFYNILLFLPRKYLSKIRFYFELNIKTVSISRNSKCVLQYSGVCLWQFPRIEFNSGGDQDQDSEEKRDRPRVSGVGASLILVCVSPLLELLHLLCIEHSQFWPLFTDNNILLYSVADSRQSAFIFEYPSKKSGHWKEQNILP